MIAAIGKDSNLNRVSKHMKANPRQMRALKNKNLGKVMFIQ